MVAIYPYVLIAVLLYIAIGPKYLLTCQILKNIRGTNKLTILDHLYCLTPLENNVIIHKALFDSKGFYVIVNWICVVGFILIGLQKVFFYQDLRINIIAVLISLVLLATIVISDCIICLTCANIFDSKIWVKVLSVLLPPLAAFWIVSDVQRVMKDTYDERNEIFSGGKDW